MKIVEYALFSIIFVYTTLWVPINLFLSSLGQKKFPITVVQNDNIRQLIKKKTGIDIDTIKISESNRPFGMMIGIPMKPQLLLSRNLYDSFTPDEMEYVVLHETWHYKLWHSVIELTVGIVLLIIGLFILKNVGFPSSTIIAVVLSVTFGIIMIRIGRLHEYQADYFTVRKMTNPEGMIQATDKFRNYYGDSYTENKNKLVQFMFYRGNPYNNRIAMAEKEIEKRK